MPNLSGGAGLNCFSCGSLLDPTKKCDKFDQRDPTQTQVCGTNEACLYYRWKKSDEDVGKRTSARRLWSIRILHWKNSFYFLLFLISQTAYQLILKFTVRGM